MTKRTKNKNKNRFNVTITFCEDEEENQLAFEHAVRILLKDDPYDDQTP